MRRVRYRVAASLDGYIAGPDGELDWIVNDPSVDLSELFAGIDTVLLGRRTYELTQQPGAPAWPAGWRVYVFSTTLRPEDHPSVRVVTTDAYKTVRALREEDGADIWLFGGGALFSSLLAAKLVDTVEVALVPILLGGGVPLLKLGAARTQLRLVESRAYPSGIASLSYEVQYTAA